MDRQHGNVPYLLKKKAKKLLNRVKDPFKKRTKKLLNSVKGDAKHLFLLSPPLSGSTLIAQIMNTSSNVSVFPFWGEGQYLTEIKDMMLNSKCWYPNYEINWNKVKQTFYSYWNPFKQVRFEKSPPNIIRPKSIAATFDDVHFLILVRNPYAQIEGLLRRDWGYNEDGHLQFTGLPVTPERAANFWIYTAEFQKKNIEDLEKICFFTYEELTDFPNETIKKIIDFMPEIQEVNIEAEFSAHNFTGNSISGIKNLNQDKINNLSSEQIAEINQCLVKRQDLLDFFNYEIIEPE